MGMILCSQSRAVFLYTFSCLYQDVTTTSTWTKSSTTDQLTSNNALKSFPKRNGRKTLVRFSLNVNTQSNMVEDIDYEQPGGGIVQSPPSRDPATTPAVVKKHQREGAAHGYKSAVKRDGIPYRKNGLFPPGDRLLLKLSRDTRNWPFEKHLPGLQSPYELLPEGGWVNGENACSHGVDLRLFYREKCDDSAEYGIVLGAVRLGDGAAIGTGFWLSAHGGAVETILDEATAEIAKIEFTPFVSTRQINVEIVKPVPLHETLLVECCIQKQKGLRCYVEGKILSDDGMDIFASCTAQLVDMRPFIRD